MCWMCDNPGVTKNDFYDDMAEKIRRFGWAVQYVEPDRLHAPWAYTVGLTLHGLPELVITGITVPAVHGLLNDEARVVLDIGPPAPGRPLTLTDGRAGEAVALPHPDAHLNTAVDMLGPDVRAVQLVWADERGRWPWDVGFRCRRGGQPVLGPRTARP